MTGASDVTVTWRRCRKTWKRRAYGQHQTDTVKFIAVMMDTEHQDDDDDDDLPAYVAGVVPTRLYSSVDRSSLFTAWQKTIGLVRMIHEETHLCISCS